MRRCISEVLSILNIFEQDESVVFAFKNTVVFWQNAVPLEALLCIEIDCHLVVADYVEPQGYAVWEICFQLNDSLADHETAQPHLATLVNNADSRDIASAFGYIGFTTQKYILYVLPRTHLS